MTGICKPVIRAIPSGKYSIDANGFWEGSAKFNPSTSMASIQFNLPSFSPESYAAAMFGVWNALDYSYGKPASTSNLAHNIIALVSGQIPYFEPISGNIQTVRYSGNPAVIFGSTMSFWHGFLFNQTMYCNVPALQTRFDASTYLVTQSYLPNTYILSNCSKLIDSSLMIPSVLAARGVNPNTIEFSFDIRTLMTSLAVCILFIIYYSTVNLLPI